MPRLMEKAREMWKRSMLHRAMLVAPPVVLLLLVGFWSASKPNAQFYTAKVERGDISQVVQATGTINAVTTVQVGSQVSGIIAELMADFNSRVKKGQVIAQIDPSILKTRLLQAEADLENARASVKNLEAQMELQRADLLASQASVDRAKAQLTEAQLNLNRTQELFSQGIVAASQQDTVKATYDQAVAGVKVAEAQLEQSRARLKGMQAQMEQAKAQVQQRKAAAEMARVDLGHTVITAPIDGTVIARNVDVGQTVAASLSAPTLFMIAQDLTKMLVYAKTDEADVGKIRVGATAQFRVDSFPNQTFRGKVAQVRMNATTVQNVVTYDTIIEFDNPDQRLFPGMTAYVTIPIAEANDVIKIPNGALRFKPDLTEDELKAIYEKHKIPYTDPRELRRRMAAAGGQGGQGGAGGFGGGGAGFAGRAGQGGAGVAGGPGGAEGEAPRPRPMRGPQAGVVWKLDKDKNLVPMAVRLGITDYTFTEMKEGKLEAGEELVIGQSTARSTSSGQQGGPMNPANRSPLGGPGGMRRM